MLQNDFTAKLLDMEHMIFRDVEHTATSVHLSVEMERRVCTCPDCGTLTDRIHDYRTQRVKDCPIQGKMVTWLYRKRRYRCPCCGKRFYERNYLLPKWHHITNRLALLTMHQLEVRISRKELANMMGVSPSTVARWLTLLEFGKPERLPSVLSIDEFKGNTEYGKFQCILTAPKERRVVDILPTFAESDLRQYLSAFQNKRSVRYFVTDMKKEYVSLAKSLFPNATIVIDRFHVVRYCTWALENVRKRVQKKLLPEQRRYFKRSRKLLLCRMSKLSAESKAAVERMLLFERDLREAYLLKEKFYEFMASKDSKQAKERLRAFRTFAFAAEIPEFNATLTMLHNWEPYILNAFDCPYSNGFTEGCNNAIKVIKRVAFGYRNFPNFRSRILVSLNAKEPSVT
jgi:transposase